LFDASARRGLITVPSCRECNESFSKDEEYFRAFILAQSYDHPEAKRISDSKVRRSLIRKPALRNRIAGELVPVIGRLGQALVWKGDEERIEHILRKIVRGLYFHHQHIRLETNLYKFWYNPLDPLVDIWKQLRGYCVGKDVCIYWPAFTRNASMVSLWWLFFYRRALFILATNIKE
jgi:hypothetical protein